MAKVNISPISIYRISYFSIYSILSLFARTNFLYVCPTYLDSSFPTWRKHHSQERKSSTLFIFNDRRSLYTCRCSEQKGTKEILLSFVCIWRRNRLGNSAIGPFARSCSMALSLFSSHCKNWFAARCEYLHLIKKDSQRANRHCEFYLIRCK